jgi:hypothetical protein
MGSLFLGRFSSDWASVQDAYYARKAHSTETKRQTGQTWQTAIISCIWQQLFLLWTIRNQALHGADSRLQAQAARREVERQLTDLYDLCNHMEPSVQQKAQSSVHSLTSIAQQVYVVVQQVPFEEDLVITRGVYAKEPGQLFTALRLLELTPEVTWSYIVDINRYAQCNYIGVNNPIKRPTW